MWVGVQTLVASIAATLTIRAMALILLDVPDEFAPLATAVPTVFFTTIGVLAALGVWSIVRRRTAGPQPTFQLIAVVALIISVVPDFWLLTASGAAAFPGATVSGVTTLIIQHVAAAAVVVWMLTLRAAR